MIELQVRDVIAFGCFGIGVISLIVAFGKTFVRKDVCSQVHKGVDATLQRMETTLTEIKDNGSH